MLSPALAVTVTLAARKWTSIVVVSVRAARTTWMCGLRDGDARGRVLRSEVHGAGPDAISLEGEQRQVSVDVYAAAIYKWINES